MIRNIIKYTFLLGIFMVLIEACTTNKVVTKRTIPINKQKLITKTSPKPTPKKELPKSLGKGQTYNRLYRVSLPEVRREFRAAWVATVANINWPTKGNYSTERQKQEAIDILNMLKDANFNAVIFQVRPSGDALYKSNLEPWSYYLTGEIGKQPSPYYDPLAFWIDEAHRRGLELHIWLNPYRAHHTNGGAVTKESIVHKMPQQIHRLKNGMYWMDPSDILVQNHTSNVVKDLVKRYDIDAVHIDDYFYPYREYNGGRDFPDERTWKSYQLAGGEFSKADWRRENVNQFIKRLNREIKEIKPYVKFGISPFGIWKPGYPSDIKGMSQYDELFADAKLWLNEGWCDYFVPQLYWKDGGAQSFTSLLKWWKGENYKERHLWVGLNTVGLKGVSDRPAEIVKQINITRNLLGNNAGEVHYSVDGISKDYRMLRAIKNIYKDKALPPLSPWIEVEELSVPNLHIEYLGANLKASWKSNNDRHIFQWLLFTQYGDAWEYEILDKTKDYKVLTKNKMGKPLRAIAIKSVDRLGNASEHFAVAVD